MVDDPATRDLRLLLCSSTQSFLITGLGLLGIDTLDEMWSKDSSLCRQDRNFQPVIGNIIPLSNSEQTSERIGWGFLPWRLLKQPLQPISRISNFRSLVGKNSPVLSKKFHPVGIFWKTAWKSQIYKFPHRKGLKFPGIRKVLGLLLPKPFKFFSKVKICKGFPDNRNCEGKLSCGRHTNTGTCHPGKTTC